MTDNELDLELARWLGAGPAALPADDRRAILNAVHTMPREGARARGRRIQFGSRTITVVAATVLLVVVGALGLSLWRNLVITPAATPSPSQPATPSATALAPTPAFASPLYGYSMDLPATWHVTPAGRPWPGTFELAPHPAYADNFVMDGNADAAMSVKAQDVPAGTTNDGWLDGWEHSFEVGGHCFGSGSPWWKVTAVGVPARHLTWRCSSVQYAASNYDVYAFVIDRRGYVVSGTPAMVELALQLFRAP